MRQRKVKDIDEKLAAFESILVAEPREFRGHWSKAFGNSHPIYLELGCGKGQFITNYARAYPDRNYIGVEGQESVILRALEKCEGLLEHKGETADGSKLQMCREVDTGAVISGEETGGYGQLQMAMEVGAEPMVADSRLMGDLTNVLFFCDFVQDLREYFRSGELWGIYLNFSDPWPKSRHAKRRLTYGGRLESYMEILAPEGTLEIKTDNEELFEFTLMEIERLGLRVEAMTRNLHESKAGCVGEKMDNGSTEDTVKANNDIAANDVVDDVFKEKERSSIRECGDCSEAAKFTTEYEDKFCGSGKNINYVRLRKA